MAKPRDELSTSLHSVAEWAGHTERLNEGRDFPDNSTSSVYRISYYRNNPNYRRYLESRHRRSRRSSGSRRRRCSSNASNRGYESRRTPEAAVGGDSRC